jgi:outer membrane protein assembly factor BamB
MNLEDILLLGLKSRVTAISKATGQQLWSTTLPSGMGANFVTLLSDNSHVFAYVKGNLHCLDLETGRILWSNDLPGFGYGLASLCFANGQSAPDLAAIQAMMDSEAASAAAANSATAGT